MTHQPVFARPRIRALLVATALVIAGLTMLPAGPAVAAPCDPPVANPVACENTKPGNPESEWGITGAGSAAIQGFATDISVDQGGTVGFKIDTSASSYRLDIYRMGYYGGDGARKVATVQPTLLNNQPACLENATTGLVDCGNWRQNASWTVPADSVSGIYFAKLVRTDGTAGASHVYFVVRDDDGASNLLFQTSDTTWQAYNAYGGNSLYTGSPAGRAYKVSYNRPFTTRDNAPEDFVFNSEYPMVRFLESNGYDVSYSTGVDTDRRGAELLEHKAFLSVGHDEYWSGQQRTNVEAARAAGVHLAFFSGNEIFWKTRWENSIDGSGTSHRTLVSYKETHANQVIDPQSPTWTGTWRDPRFSPPGDGGRPENALSGQIFMVNCCAVNMQVGSADGKMRFWRNTRVANLATGATTTIGTNVIGYEWDEDRDNGFRPAGAFRLSQTAASGEVLQDYGSTYAQGSATHSMTMYRHSSGALVFGAGTIQWAWALDSNHDRGSAAADVAAQQATVNLFADMGVQPATLRTGLTAATASADNTAPASTITAPANNANVPVGSALTVTGTASDTGGRVGGVEVSTDNGTTWHRATGRESWSYTFTPSTSSTLRIRSRAADDSGNIENPAAGVTVIAGSGSGGGSGTCPCTIWPASATPDRTDPDSSPVELGVKFQANTNGFITGIRYYKPSEATGTHVGTLWSGTGTKLATATFTNESANGWQQADFATPVAVTANTTYVASYFAPSRYAVSSSYFATAATTNGPLTALRDGTDGGNGVYRYGSTAGSFPTATFSSENYWVDVVYAQTSGGGSDTTKPTVSTRTPAAGATNVALDSTASATFSEAVQQSTISFELRNPANTLVPATMAYDSATNKVTLTPSTALQANTTYTANLSGATDTAGNAMDPVTWTFTTTTTLDTTKPTVATRIPAPGMTNVATTSTVSAGFDEAVQQATIKFELRTSANQLVASTTTYDAATRTAKLTPASPLQAGTTYTASLSGAADTAGNVMDPVTWSFTTATSTNNCPCSIWPSTATPARTDPDRNAVEVGVRFRANAAGFVTGIRFYKPVESTGTHVGALWTNTGTKLGSVTFTNESASGWQQATFSSPIAVTANTTYVASYFTPSRYAVTSSYFTTATTRGPLTALQDGTDGANGVYRYTSTAGAFPNQTFKSENYWVDVVFEDTDTSKPTVTSRTPAPGATGVPVATTATAVFSEPVQQSTITFELRNPANNLVPSTTSYDPATRTATLTPNVALAGSTTYAATVSGAKDTAGNVMDPVTWTFTTEAADTTKPTLTSRTPAPGATDVPVSSTVSGVFSEAVQPPTIGFELRNPSGNLVPATTAYNATTRTATLTPSAALSPSTVYTASVSGAKDIAGNTMDTVTWSFTTAAADTTKPTVTGRVPAPGTINVPTSSSVNATFSEPVQQSTITFELRSSANNLVASTTSYDAASRTATLRPSAALAPGTTYTATVSGAADTAGNVMDPVTWTFTTTASTFNCPCTVWPSTATPERTDPDASAVELGARFRASQDGYITGIRYYRPAESTGTHVGSLWTNTGTRLASVTFPSGSASGWQEATFDAPVPVTANTTYVASYFTPSRYAVSSGYFATSATTRGPLTALRDGTDGANGVYRYTSTAGAFPNSTYNSENYWVDVVYAETATDTTAPTVADRTPAAGSTGVPVTTRPAATFSENVVASTISMELRNASDQVVTATSSYDAASRTVTLTPAADLDYSSSYTVRLSGAKDSSGNTMTDVSWTFQTSAPPPPGVEQGPGGPIAVVTSDANRSSTFLTEIARAEGLNEFATVKNTALSAATLAGYDVVVLGDVTITDAQVTALTNWVNAGGNLIAMRPDSRLLTLAGLTAQTGTVADGYIAVNASTEPGAGITTETMQFHGPANRYALNGATSVAALFTSATASAGNPAVTLRNVGTSGGQVAVFAYDLARSVRETRQGNPAWAGQNRDGLTPNRSNDLFFGGTSTDWVNLDKVRIPQADEQQRLLANLVTVMDRDRMPVPRFWYFPGTHKAVLVATGDDHGNGGTAGRFNTYNSSSPAGCSVALWQCARFTSYIYPGTPLTSTQASSYNNQGFEVGLHPQNGCTNFTSLAELTDTYTNQLGDWRAKYTGLPSPTTNRYHCIVWSDWASQAKAELSQGMRLDTNYYYYPGSWIADRPGFMTGSGMPMRFTDTDGSLIDVYQTNTVMTDESGQSYPFTPNTLLDRALGAEGYYGAFTANLHTDNATTFEDTQVLASAQSRNVPVIAARQLLTWLDGRNGSSFNGLAWNNGALDFTVAVGAGATQLTAMLPTTGPGGATLSSITRGGSPVTYTLSTIKGQQYAMFAASGGAYKASYSTGGALRLTTARTTAVAQDTATLSWQTSRPATSTLAVGTSPEALDTRATVAGRTETHELTVDDLKPDQTYYYRVSARDEQGKVRVWPARDKAPATFTTPAADRTAPVVENVRTVPLPDGTARVTWTTNEPATSRVRFGEAGDRVDRVGLDDELVTEHAVVLTGLDADRGYVLRVSSSDASGNSSGPGLPVRLRTVDAGVAVQTAEDFRTGTSTGNLRIGERGFGVLTLSGPGKGAYRSTVLDAGQKVDWRRSVVKSSLPPGSTVEVSVRTGPNRSPDGTWSSWKATTDGAPLATSGRYLQFRVELAATLAGVPTVSMIGFTHSGELSPAHADSPAGPEAR